MILRFRHLLALALGTALVSPLALAQNIDPVDTPERSLWDELDADADGRVSREEGAIDAHFAERFATLDADGDGFVTDTEYRGSAGAIGAQLGGDTVRDEAGNAIDDGVDGSADDDWMLADPLDDRDGMDDDGTGLDDQDGG